MKRILASILLSVLLATTAHTVQRGITIYRNSTTIIAGRDSVRTLLKQSIAIDTLGIAPNVTEMGYYASGDLTAGVDSGLVVYFRDLYNGRLHRMQTQIDTLWANADTTDGTAFNVFFPLNPKVMGDSLVSYLQLLDNADADSAKNVRVRYEVTKESPLK